MRSPRLKLNDQDAFYHVYNRTAGFRGERPFGNQEKRKLLEILTRLSQLYVIEIIAYQVMNNHFHLLLCAPAQPPSRAEAARRYAAYHHNQRTVEPASPAGERLAERLRDISAFLHALEFQFAQWYNRSRLPQRRRGALWSGRFKHTILQGGQALWDCWKYIELNALRVGLTRQALAYRFGSLGNWTANGYHPFAEHLQRCVLPVLQRELGLQDLAAVYARLKEVAEQAQVALRGQAAAAEGANRKPLPFTDRVDQRVRYWVEGVVIGTAPFVREVVAKTTWSARRNLLPAAQGTLCSWRRLWAVRD